MEKNKQQPGEGVASDQTRQSDNLFIYKNKTKNHCTNYSVQ